MVKSNLRSGMILFLMHGNHLSATAERVWSGSARGLTPIAFLRSLVRFSSSLHHVSIVILFRPPTPAPFPRPPCKWNSKDPKKGTTGARIVTSAKRREIARRNFARLLAEATRREDPSSWKRASWRHEGARIFSCSPPLFREKEMRPSFREGNAQWVLW